MVTHARELTAAFDLVEQAALLLDGAGDMAGALRLKHAIAIIRNDGRYPAPVGLDAPLSLMKTALALVDQDGHRASAAACHLQHAIDCARGAKPLAEGEELDFDLFYPFPIEPVPTILN